MLNMLATSSIEIDTKLKGLDVPEMALRSVSREDEQDTGWRFQAIISNVSSARLTDLEFALRYYDNNGSFLGIDEGYSLGPDDIGPADDKAVSVSLNIPPSASRAVFSVKAQKESFVEKHSLVLFGAGLVLMPILFSLGDFLKR